jgi:hypothetical protein
MSRLAVAYLVFVMSCAAQRTAQGTTQALPVSVQLQPPSPGFSLTLKVTCTGLSKRECAKLSKPTSVAVKSPPYDAGSTSFRFFTPAPSSGNDLNLTLTGDALVPGMLVQVNYYDGKHSISTAWEPVIPSAEQTICCDFTSTPGVIHASAPIAGSPVYLQAKDSSGQVKPLLVSGSVEDRDRTYRFWWRFAVTQCPPVGDLEGCVGPGDTVVIYAAVDGQPKQLAQGSWPSAPPPPESPVAVASPAPVAVPIVPVVLASGGSAAPARFVPGNCNDPQITNALNAGGTIVNITLGCLAKPPNFVLYIDNKPKLEPADLTWTQGATQFQYTATLTSPLRPYQWVKVIQYAPAELDPDPTAVQVQNPGGLVPAAGEQPWWVPTPGRCPPPTIRPGLHAGDTSVVVTFPNPPAGGAACHPDISRVKIFADNAAIDARSLSWALSGDNPIVYTAHFSVPLQPYQRVKALQFNPAQNVADSVAQIVPGQPAAPAAATPAPSIAQIGPCADPYIASAPGLTDSIQVILGCLPTSPAKELQLWVNGKRVPPSGVKWVQTGSSPITMTAKLASKLNDGDSVYVLQTGQRDPISSAQIAAGPPKPPDPSSIQMVQEGATSVTGTAKGLDKIVVNVMDGNILRQSANAAVDSTTNSFTANLTSPLQADQQLQVYGIAKSGTQSDNATPIEVQPLTLDWGRVRGYFTGGVILSNNNSQFNLTSANLFLGFNVDKQWAMPGAAFNQIGQKRSERFRFNTYFDARLTAIPTGTTGTSTTASTSTPTLTGGSGGGTGGSTGSSSSGSSGSSSSSSAASNPSPNPTSLLSNNQAAALQVGAYLPITVSTWDFREKNYSLFVAPIGKVGFYTVIDSGNAAFQAAENANRSTSTFFPFYSYGVRVGHRRDYSTGDGRVDTDRAPEQLSYLDISVGKWSNYEYLAPYNFTTAALQPSCTVPAPNAATAACDVRQQLWRYGFEGLLVIPNTPLVIGLSANVSAQHPRGMFYLSPPDDLRFLFGVRFDASKFTGALTKLAGGQ